MIRAVILFICIVFGCSFLSQAQKSKVIAVFQLIGNDEYEEAKKAIEEAIDDEKTMDWYRTWYAMGLLCQTAYQKAKTAKDKKKYDLYPDQLYVAFDAYAKALSLDTRGRIYEHLAPMYVLLANEFQKLGEQHYNSSQYKDAFKAFDHALQINQNPVFSFLSDTNLLYNTALAAYQSKEWEKAIEYLSILHKENYSSNASHMLFASYLEKGDTISAERVLIESVDHFEDNEDLVLLLVDLLFQTSHTKRALAILDSASSGSPSKYIFPYTKGLVYQKTGQYQKAIDAYEKAIILAPDELKICVNLGTCYYNIGVEIDENARTIADNRTYLMEKERSATAFESSLQWFEKAYKKDPDNQKVIMMLYKLYKVLGITDKIKSIEKQID